MTAAIGRDSSADSVKLWADARSSVAKGILALLAAALGLGLFVWSMPPFQVRPLMLHDPRQHGMRLPTCCLLTGS